MTRHRKTTKKTCKAKTTITAPRARTKVKAKPNKGNGRPKGAKDKVPKTFKRTIQALMQEVLDGHTKDIKDATLRGINSEPAFAHHYLKFMASYTAGLPEQGMNLKASFREDELSSASRDLERKFAMLLAHVKAKPVVSESDTETADPGLSTGTAG